MREAAKANPARWSARSAVITWRGATTGLGNVTTAALDAGDPTLLQRVRLCLVLKDVPGTDVRVTGVVPSPTAAIDKARLAAAGLLGDFIEPLRWLDRKFAIDKALQHLNAELPLRSVGSWPRGGFLVARAKPGVG